MQRSSATAIGGENVGEIIEGRAALSDQRALSARTARLARSTAQASLRHRARRSSAPLTWPGSQLVDGPPMLSSENARLSAGSTSTCAAAISFRRNRDAGARSPRRCDADRIFHLLVRAVRVPGTRHRAPEDRRADHAAIIFVLLYLTFRAVGEALLLMVTCRSPARRLLVHLGAGARFLGGDRGRLHRARRRRRRFGVVMLIYLGTAWHAAAAGEPAAAATLQAAIRGRGAARATQSDDGGGDCRRPAADLVWAPVQAQRSCSASRHRWSAE